MNKLSLSPEIRNSMIRGVLMLICGMLIAQHKLTGEQASHLIDAVINAIPTISALVGALGPIWLIFWGAISHTQNKILRRVAQLPEVDKVVVKTSAKADTPAAELAKDSSVAKVQFAMPPHVGGDTNPSDRQSTP